MCGDNDAALNPCLSSRTGIISGAGKESVYSCSMHTEKTTSVDIPPSAFRGFIPRKEPMLKTVEILKNRLNLSKIFIVELIEIDDFIAVANKEST